MGIGASTGVYFQGSYLMDIGEGTAEVVERNTAGNPIYISMISVNDVGRFLAAAIELGPRDWPSEFRMAGDRRTVSEILSWAEAVRGGNRPEFLVPHWYTNLNSQVDNFQPISLGPEISTPILNMQTIIRTFPK
jgi:hypothetical protein